jgi:hypothetical protein
MTKAKGKDGEMDRGRLRKAASQSTTFVALSFLRENAVYADRKSQNISRR